MDLRAYLRSLDVDTLAELLAEQAVRDPELHGRLTERAGEAAETSRVGAVLDTLQRLLDAGSQADLAPLARRTVDRIVDAEDHAELPRAVRLYARACAAHPPVPAELAEWLSALAFSGYHVDLTAFAEALGDNGLGHLKSIVDKDGPEWLSEQVAAVTGDADTLLEILTRRPPSVEVNRRIMRVLHAAGRTEDAMSLLRGEFRHTPIGGELATHKADIDALIAKGPAHYAEVAKVLRTVRTLCRKAGEPAEFTTYLAGLVTTHKRKTRLLAEIRDARIAIPK